MPGDIFVHHHGAERQMCAGQPFCECHQIGFAGVTVSLPRKPFATATKAAHNFIGQQECSRVTTQHCGSPHACRANLTACSFASAPATVKNTRPFLKPAFSSKTSASSARGWVPQAEVTKHKRSACSRIALTTPGC